MYVDIESAIFSADGRSIVTSQVSGRHDPADVGVRRLGLADGRAGARGAGASLDAAHRRSGPPAGGGRGPDRRRRRRCGTSIATSRSPPSAAPGSLYTVAFRPDGQQLAFAGADGTVGLGDPDTGEQQLVLRGHESSIGVLSFSPDGTRLASVDVERRDAGVDARPRRADRDRQRTGHPLARRRRVPPVAPPGDLPVVTRSTGQRRAHRIRPCHGSATPPTPRRHGPGGPSMHRLTRSPNRRSQDDGDDHPPRSPRDQHPRGSAAGAGDRPRRASSAGWSWPSPSWPPRCSSWWPCRRDPAAPRPWYSVEHGSIAAIDHAADAAVVAAAAASPPSTTPPTPPRSPTAAASPPSTTRPRRRRRLGSGTRWSTGASPPSIRQPVGRRFARRCVGGAAAASPPSTTEAEEGSTGAG